MAKKQTSSAQSLSAKQIDEINEGFLIAYRSETEEIDRMKAAFAKYGIK